MILQTPIRWLALAAILLFAVSDGSQQTLAEGSPQDLPQTQEGPRRPVLVELFTSEGCSSCPPADTLLIRLEQLQPVEGAEIIPLGFHVDYWDHIGWRDRFASADFTQRQWQYAELFKADTVYTPQMVVDGQTEFNGADARRAAAAIAQAAQQDGKARVELKLVAASAKRATLNAIVSDLAPTKDERPELWAAITESNLSSQASKGENSGRRLAHTGVVRYLRRLATLNSQPDHAKQFELKIDSDWKRQDLRAVVFVQERSSRRILGAAQLPLGLAP
ncbi:MAG: DUF1223 domain-containing protein [Candidatus Acidiferrales bacterium]